MENNKHCVRCLLEEAGRIDVSKLVQERIAEIPEALRCDEKTYAERLALCTSCDHMNAGTCQKCGCYAQLRAARADNYCPHEKRKW